MFSRIPVPLLGVIFYVMSWPAVAFELILAKVSSDSSKGLKQLRPMVEFAARELNRYGVSSGNVRLYKSSEALAEAIHSGEVHWVTDTGLGAAKLMSESGAVPIALKWKKGRADYQSVVFARADAGIHSVRDLVGASIAFEDESSLSAYFLPRLLMENEGLTLHEIPSINAEKKSDAVNYVFARTEKNIALWVEKGLVAAGALSSDDWASPKRVLPETKEKFAKVLVSDPHPRAYELVSPSLPTEVRDALAQLLLNMDEETHPKVLKAYEKTSQFQKVGQKELKQLELFAKRAASW